MQAQELVDQGGVVSAQTGEPVECDTSTVLYRKSADRRHLRRKGKAMKRHAVDTASVQYTSDSDASDAVQRAMVKALESITQVNHHLDCRLDAARCQMWQMQQQLVSCQAAFAALTAQNEHLRFVVRAYEESLLANRPAAQEVQNRSSDSDARSECSSHDYLALPKKAVSMQA